MLNDQVSGPGLVAKPVLSNIITFCLEVVYATVEKVRVGGWVLHMCLCVHVSYVVCVHVSYVVCVCVCM